MELPLLGSVCQPVTACLQVHGCSSDGIMAKLLHFGAAQILCFSAVFFRARNLCWHQVGFSVFLLTSVDYMEGHEPGELDHSREKDVPLEMEKFSQLLFSVGEGDLKRSVVFVLWLFALKTGLGNNIAVYIFPALHHSQGKPALVAALCLSP